MKRNLILVIIWQCMSLCGMAQEQAKITYKIHASKTPKTEDASVASFVLKTDEQFSNLKFELLVNGKESIFKHQSKLALEEQTYFYKMALAASGASNRVWYTNTAVNQLIEQYEFMGRRFLIETTLDYLPWVFTSESRKIEGYTAYKATCMKPSLGSSGAGERKIEVWYTPDVPIKAAPLGLTGVPGLILEVSFHRITYTVDTIELAPESGIAINKPTKGIKMPLAEFIEVADKKLKQLKKERARQ